MPRYPIELIDTPFTAQELHDQETRNKRTYQENQSNVITTIDDAESIALKTTGNGYNFAEGNHAPLTIDRDEAYISGTPGATFDPNGDGNAAFIDVGGAGVTRYDNMEFQGTVRIEQGTAIFTNCVFHGMVTAPLTVRTHFIGCVFKGQPNATQCLANALTFVIGCSNKGGVHLPVPAGALLETT